MTEFYVVSLKHTKRSEPYITLWRENDRGYTLYPECAGKYSEEQIRDRLGYYDDGDRTMAVPCYLLDAIAVVLPDGYDKDRGIPNTTAAWTLIESSRPSL